MLEPLLPQQGLGVSTGQSSALTSLSCTPAPVTPLDDAYSLATEFEDVRDLESGSYGAPIVQRRVPAPSALPKAPKRKIVGYPVAASSVYRDQGREQPQHAGPAQNRLDSNFLPSVTSGIPTPSGLVAPNPSLSYSHHPQTYAPLPAPLPRGPLPYPGLYAGKMPPTTPMMLPTQHTFAFTPRVPPGQWASVAPGQHQHHQLQRGQTAQLGQLRASDRNGLSYSPISRNALRAAAY